MMNGMMMKMSLSSELSVFILSSLLSFSTTYVMGIIDNRVSDEVDESIMALSPIIGSEEYYLRMRELNSRFPKQPGMNARETKEDVCESISTSLYLLDSFDDNFKFIIRVPINDSKFARPAKCDHPDCLDRQDIFVLGQTVDEYVFTCRTETGNEFFVSREYNLFWWMESSAPHWSGRFVFKYGSGDSSKRIVVAMAEKPAIFKPSFFSPLEGEQDRYKTMIKYRADHEVNDTILNSLSELMKVRLCTIIVSAFQWPFSFSPRSNYTEILTLQREMNLPNATSNDEDLALRCDCDNLRTEGHRTGLKILLGDNTFDKFFAISKEEDIFAYLIR